MSIGWYAPCFWAETDELLELARILAKNGTILTAHLREEPYGINEVLEIGEKAGISIEIAHYDGTGTKEARANGIYITYDAYPYRAGSSHLGEILPPWLYEGVVNSMLERLSDSNVRKEIKEIAKKRVLKGYDWNNVVIAYLSNEKIKQYERLSIGKIKKNLKILIL